MPFAPVAATHSGDGVRVQHWLGLTTIRAAQEIFVPESPLALTLAQAGSQVAAVFLISRRHLTAAPMPSPL
jgi:hypothetical protein